MSLECLHVAQYLVSDSLKMPHISGFESVNIFSVFIYLFQSNWIQAALITNSRDSK